MSETWTVARILAWMAQDFAALGVGSPRLDAELLLCRVLTCDRVRLYMDMQRPLSRAELEAARALVQRRRKREPVAYILAQREFYKRDFEVNRSVLVPRPETELLVDRALEALPQAKPAQVLDLCTGSGVVAITIALERPEVRLSATDLSPDALTVAASNVARHGLSERVALQEGDLFAPLPADARYEVITANPPYVADGEYAALAPEITDHEPKLALLAGRDGLDVIRRIIVEAPARLAPAGTLLLEIGAGQARAVAELLHATGRFEAVRAHRDLSGIERVVEAVLRA